MTDEEEKRNLKKLTLNVNLRKKVIHTSLHETEKKPRKRGNASI